MRSRLAAAAAGAIPVPGAGVAFSPSPQPIPAGTNATEPVQSDAWDSESSQRCRTLSRVPPGADRLRIVVSSITGGARDLRVKIVNAAGLITRGDLHGVKLGENVIKLSP